ncbi:MAG: hypothetical protein C0506_15045 [Anaerolinea sp.]|nr:hypothetical protein [Anaerolinea sp.]
MASGGLYDRSPTLADEAHQFFASDELPASLWWVAWLSPVHLRLFAVELTDALASPSPDMADLEALLESWEATAELDASPELQARIERIRRGEFEPADEWLKNLRTALTYKGYWAVEETEGDPFPPLSA